MRTRSAINSRACCFWLANKRLSAVGAIGAISSCGGVTNANAWLEAVRARQMFEIVRAGRATSATPQSCVAPNARRGAASGRRAERMQQPPCRDDFLCGSSPSEPSPAYGRPRSRPALPAAHSALTMRAAWRCVQSADHAEQRVQSGVRSWRAAAFNCRRSSSSSARLLAKTGSERCAVR